MSLINPVSNTNPSDISKRLLFIRESDVLNVWHIADASLWKKHSGILYYVALHGKLVKAHTVRNSLDKLPVTFHVSSASDILCQRCVEEFAIAFDVIKERNMLVFGDHRIPFPEK